MLAEFPKIFVKAPNVYRHIPRIPDFLRDPIHKVSPIGGRELLKEPYYQGATGTAGPGIGTKRTVI